MDLKVHLTLLTGSQQIGFVLFLTQGVWRSMVSLKLKCIVNKMVCFCFVFYVHFYFKMNISFKCTLIL